MKIWVMLFTIALFAGGACLGVAVDRTYLAKPAPPPAAPAASPSSGRPWEMSVHHFVKQLGLTEGQDRQLDLILGKTQQDVEAFTRAIRFTHEKSRESVMKILTDEQKAKLEELKAAEWKKRHEEEIQRSLRFYTRVLGLDEAQQGKVRAVLAELKERKRAYFRNEEHGGDHSRIRGFFRGLREEQSRRLKDILTPEQHKRYSEFEEWDR